MVDPAGLPGLLGASEWARGRNQVIRNPVKQNFKRYLHTAGPFFFAVVNIAVAGHRTRSAPPLQHPPLHVQHAHVGFDYRLEHMRRLGPWRTSVQIKASQLKLKPASRGCRECAGPER